MRDKEPNLVEGVESRRLAANRLLTPESRAELGQFLTPSSVSRFMAGLTQPARETIRLLDPGAGVGSLTAAWIEELLSRKRRPKSIRLTAVEIDRGLIVYLQRTIDACSMACRNAGVEFSAQIVEGDFVTEAAEMLSERPLLSSELPRFDCVIMNPPYRKINSDSSTRRRLRGVGIETSNVYTAFLWLAMRLLDQRGELIAITPRSFCNGPYFRPFRSAFLRHMKFSRIHVFDSRKAAFQDEGVLQENVIFRAVKSPSAVQEVVISTSHGPDDPDVDSHRVWPDEVVSVGDPEQLIHIVTDELGKRIAGRINSFNGSLTELGIEVSTGRVVDFRVRDSLLLDAGSRVDKCAVAPLIYPTHLERGGVVWPKQGKKPNYLRVTDETRSLLVPSGIYVLVKRFSAKEERRRLTAAVCRGREFANAELAFENHLNYFHARGRGLSLNLAQGLAAYLNSTLVDSFFRQFSGHTQVNATDLRSLPYPDRKTLERIGETVGQQFLEPDQIDALLEECLSPKNLESHTLNGEKANHRGARNSQGVGPSARPGPPCQQELAGSD